MSSEPTSSPASSEQVKSPAKPWTHPWVSWLAVIACCVVFLGLASEKNNDSLSSLSKWGHVPASAIWQGAYWGLLSSVFVHSAIWHLVFNFYWLWELGSLLERTIGSLRFLVFFVAAALVSSSFQLALSGDTGIGASGVVYAIFGFMWTSRGRFPQFKKVLNNRTVLLFVAWLIGCVVATYLKIWMVGNAAHISGLLFGCVVAGYFVARYKPRLTLSGLAALVVFSIIPLFWCPWSVPWLAFKAYRAHEDHHYAKALQLYTRILEMEDNNAWAYHNRGCVYQALGEPENAEADWETARKLNPRIGNSE